MPHERAHHRQPEKSAQIASSRWFDIPAFPSSPNGFQLELTANSPRHITRTNRILYSRTVERFRREKEGAPGYHDGTKVNIHPSFDPKRPDIISYTATPTAYSDFIALSNKRIPQTLQEQIRLSGVQAFWLTTEPDGTHKAVFEIRSQHSGLYPSAPGTIGGSIDGELNYVGSLGESAILKDAGPKHILNHALKETHEELGIPQIVLENFQNGSQSMIVDGLVLDKKRKYYDVLLQGTLPYAQVEVQRLYEQHKAAGNDNIHDPMPTKLAFVDATPDSFANLLTKYLIPLTPVTQASFLLAGYMLKMQEVFHQTGNQDEAVKQAIVWKDTVMVGMTEKDMAIDTAARISRKKAVGATRREFWRTLLTEPVKGDVKAKYNTWRKETKRPRSYDTTLTPEKQGLPPVVEELNGAVSH